MQMRYTSYQEQTDPHRYTFTTVPCPECGKTAEITVNGSDLFAYHQGGKVQDCFPYLSAADRERLFLTGTCGPCFDQIFGEE